MKAFNLSISRAVTGAALIENPPIEVARVARHFERESGAFAKSARIAHRLSVMTIVRREIDATDERVTVFESEITKPSQKRTKNLQVGGTIALLR
jgi:hypothetical protein